MPLYKTFAESKKNISKVEDCNCRIRVLPAELKWYKSEHIFIALRIRQMNHARKKEEHQRRIRTVPKA